jgi:hypothetical protein
MHRELNQIRAKPEQREQNSISSSGTRTSTAKTGEDHRKKENEHKLAQNKPMKEVPHKFLCRPHETWWKGGIRFLKDYGMKDPVVDEYEDECSNEGNEEFFPIHNFFLLRFC